MFLNSLNLPLGMLGIGLLMMMVSGEAKDNLLMRVAFLAYFVAVIDLNAPRLSEFSNVILLSFAGLLLALWSFKRAGTEEDI